MEFKKQMERVQEQRKMNQKDKLQFQLMIKIGSDNMVLTYNYQDLQNIKEKMKKEHQEMKME